MFSKPGVLVLSLLGPAYAVTAHCEIYMTEHKAVDLIFPGQKMVKSQILLTSNQITLIEKLSDDSVKNKTITVWKNKNKDVVVIDRALGKHEMITYAVGITSKGKVKGIEILEYRESYGHEIKRDAWRNQFVGKDKTALFKLDKDIKNISGATLSSSHVTAGVKRVLESYDIIKQEI